MTSHDLKVWPQFYGPIERGEKPFELRRDDRFYEVGDRLTLREFEPDLMVEPDVAGCFTGAECVRWVSYVLRAGDVPNFVAPHEEPPPSGGPLAEGFVILGLTRHRWNSKKMLPLLAYLACVLIGIGFGTAINTLLWPPRPAHMVVAPGSCAASQPWSDHEWVSEGSLSFACRRCGSTYTAGAPR